MTRRTTGDGRILELSPDAGIVIVTSHGRPGYLKRALADGVRGLLPKTTPSATLATVIRTVHRGGRYVDPEPAAEAISAGDSALTAREADVLEFALDGDRAGPGRRPDHRAVALLAGFTVLQPHGLPQFVLIAIERRQGLFDTTGEPGAADAGALSRSR